MTATPDSEGRRAVVAAKKARARAGYPQDTADVEAQDKRNERFNDAKAKQAKEGYK